MNFAAKFNLTRGDFHLDVELSLPAIGVTALFGASAAGKTTLLRAIAGLEKIAGGYLKFGDQIWQDDQQFVATHRRGLAYVFQEASLFEHLSVRANIEYGAKRTAAVGEVAVSIEQAIELLGIELLLARKPSTLSGGERQRVAIARSLATSPKLLLMDEPLAALDNARKQELMPYLESLGSSLAIPIIYVSHSMDEVARLADYLVLMEEGKVLASAPITQLLTRLDMPLAHDESAEALIESTVAEHDDDYQLTYLDFSGGRFTVPQKPLGIGEQVRIRIAARDVSITLERQTNTSILNCFASRIDEIMPQGEAQVIVRLLIGDNPMLARITRKSVVQLGLTVGMHVFVQIKSAAVLS